MAKATRPRRNASRAKSLPVSLRLSARLRERVRRFAAARELQEATAIRTLTAERLDEIEIEGELRAAESWQIRQAVTTWDRFRKGKGRVVSREAIDRAFAEARSRHRSSPTS